MNTSHNSSGIRFRIAMLLMYGINLPLAIAFLLTVILIPELSFSYTPKTPAPALSCP